MATRFESLNAGRRHARFFPAQWATAPWGALILLTVTALAFRAVQFGNPTVHVDDQFYLLVGDQMWQGLWPYVDIWDRKPIGLFLIYAGLRGFGGDGILTYQIAATLSAIATAFAILRIASRIATPSGSLIAGIVYLASLGMVGGDGGQTPVFYNLVVALAALALIRVLERRFFDRRARTGAALAMLLMGLAIQVKYTVLFEGAFFGLALLWRARRDVAPPVLVRMACLWLTLGVAPTAIAWGAYTAAGHGQAFFFANFSSIFLRGHDETTVTIGHLIAIVVRLLPLAIVASVSLWSILRTRGEEAVARRQAAIFMAGWAIVAIAGVLVFGGYFDHYALPMLVPLAAAAAPLLGGESAGSPLSRRARLLVPILLLAYSSVLTVATVSRNRHNRGTGSEVEQMAAFIRPRLNGCLFVYDGDPILYPLTGSCLPSRWAFPDHLNNAREDGAIGVDTLAETAWIVATRPPLVVSGAAALPQTNRRTWQYMQTALQHDYREVGRWQVGVRSRVLYERLPGH